jgi:hypothetical protein
MIWGVRSWWRAVRRMRLRLRRRSGLGRATAPGGASPTRIVLIVSTGLCVAIGTLVWVGYVATRGWRLGTDLLLERRQAEALALTSGALNRDMKGAWRQGVCAVSIS